MLECLNAFGIALGSALRLHDVWFCVLTQLVCGFRNGATCQEHDMAYGVFGSRRGEYVVLLRTLFAPRCLAGCGVAEALAETSLIAQPAWTDYTETYASMHTQVLIQRIATWSVCALRFCFCDLLPSISCSLKYTFVLRTVLFAKTHV